MEVEENVNEVVTECFRRIYCIGRMVFLLHLSRKGKVVHRRRYPTASLILLSFVSSPASVVLGTRCRFCSIEEELSDQSNDSLTQPCDD